VYSTNPCIGPDSITVNITMTQDSTTLISRTTLVGGAFGYGVSVRFQDTDFATDSAGNLVPTTTSSSVGQPTSTTTLTPTPTPTPHDKDHGLSKGAIAGIAVGIIIGVIVVGLLLACCVIGKKRNVKPAKRRADANESANGNGYEYNMAALEEPHHEARTGIVSA
jgi:hypothetical protein